MLHLKRTLSMLTSLLLICLVSCEIQRSDKKDKQQPEFNTESAGIDTTNMARRDGIPVFPVPGSQIENEKVDAMLASVSTSFSEINPPYATEEELKDSINKLKQLLRKESVRNDKELQFAFHTSLGNVYGELFGKTERKKYFAKAKKHINLAIQLLENQPKYKADLAGAYMARVGIYLIENKYEKAIDLTKYLIENYQSIGFGPYENWFASHQVTWLHNLARRYLEPEEQQQIVNYLKMISGTSENEVGITAQIELFRHYARNGETDRAIALSKTIKERMESLDNTLFKKDKLRRIENTLEHMKNKKTSHHQTSHNH